MGQSPEQILISLGYDATEVQRGTQAMLAGQRRAQEEYVGFWKTTIDRRDAIEQAQNIKTVERERLKNATLLRMNAERLEAEAAQQTAANAEIAAGSGAADYVGLGAKRKAARTAASDLEAAAIGGAVGHAAGKSTSIFREIQVLMHEGIAGRWKQFVSSFSRLLMFMGLTAQTLVSGIPIIGTGIAAIFSNLRMKHSLDEMAGGYGSIQGTIGTEAILRKRLTEEIDKMAKAGVITGDQAHGFTSRMGNLSGIMRVQRELAPLLPQGFNTDLHAKEKEAKAVADLQEKTRQEDLAGDREKMSHLERIKSLAKEHSEILEKTATMNTKSLEYAQAQYALSRLQKQMDADRAEIEKERVTLQKDYYNDIRQKHHVEHEMNMVERETPTVEMLAGRRFTQRLNKAYGQGGAFDLEAGNGPFAGIAQAYMLTQKQQMWDIINGNAQFDARGNLVGGQAYMDRQKQLVLGNMLGAAGLETPAMKLEEMKIHLDEINGNLSELLKTAKQDGIVLKDP